MEVKLVHDVCILKKNKQIQIHKNILRAMPKERKASKRLKFLRILYSTGLCPS